MFISSFGKHPVYFRPTQVVSKAEDHPSKITEAEISHGEVLGIMTDTTRYRKRDTDARDMETINKHLAVSREALTGVDAVSYTHLTLPTILLV